MAESVTAIGFVPDGTKLLMSPATHVLATEKPSDLTILAR